MPSSGFQWAGDDDIHHGGRFDDRGAFAATDSERAYAAGAGIAGAGAAGATLRYDETD